MQISIYLPFMLSAFLVLNFNSNIRQTHCHQHRTIKDVLFLFRRWRDVNSGAFQSARPPESHSVKLNFDRSHLGINQIADFLSVSSRACHLRVTQ